MKKEWRIWWESVFEIIDYAFGWNEPENNLYVWGMIALEGTWSLPTTTTTKNWVSFFFSQKQNKTNSQFREEKNKHNKLTPTTRGRWNL